MGSLNLLKLKEVHNSLLSEFKHYISMIALGSVVSGDKFIENRSDYDILLVFLKYSDEDMVKIRKTMKNFSFDDHYMFIPITKKLFLANKHISHEFPAKFRSRTLYGEDIIPLKKIPSRKEAGKIFYAPESIKGVKRRIIRDLINVHFWSEHKVRDVFWELFKNCFIYLAIKCFAETGRYPTSRRDTANMLECHVLTKTIDILENIDKAHKKEIIRNAESLVEYLTSIGI